MASSSVPNRALVRSMTLTAWALIALEAQLQAWQNIDMAEELPPLRMDGPTMMSAAMAYHMRRCLDALGERRVQRIMGLERYQVQGVALGTMALTSRRRDLLDRLFVAVMLLDGVEPWEWDDD